MKHLLCGLLLVLATTAFAQQQSPSTPPSQATPPTFPEGREPSQTMPPDKAAPPPQKNASADVQQRIQDKLDAEPSLSKQNVKANATDSAVILTGIVDTERQHRVALGIAQSYAGNREVMDRVEVKAQK